MVAHAYDQVASQSHYQKKPTKRQTSTLDTILGPQHNEANNVLEANIMKPTMLVKVLQGSIFFEHHYCLRCLLSFDTPPQPECKIKLLYIK